MITEYFRPQTLEQALELINRPDTLPLGGGTRLNQPSTTNFAVVDLQALGLNQLRKAGNNLEIGATTTLQQLLEAPDSPSALKQAIQLEAPLNIRNMGTIAGTLAACDGRSPFATAMLALDAVLEIRSSTAADKVSLGNYLPLRPRGLITSITIPLSVKLAYEQVARTPVDKPIVSVAVCQWSSGRTRLALGGFGKSPLLGMDGTDATGLHIAARNAFHEATDEWASAEYRMDVAATLAKRCLEQMQTPSP